MAAKVAKLIVEKKASKKEREKEILFRLTEYYISTCKPVGSNTLKEVGFLDLSSATIRNYFQELEEDGFLQQLHTSGGRIPTDKAYTLYAQECQNTLKDSEKVFRCSLPLEIDDTSELTKQLSSVAEELSKETKCAAFLCGPRFDQDYITDMKIINIDSERYVLILLSHFGSVHTELLRTAKKLSHHGLNRFERYFQLRLRGQVIEKDLLSDDDRDIANEFYQEALTRYLIKSSSFTQEDVLRTGFSKLLYYPEMQDAEALVSSLSLFENQHALRLLLLDTTKSMHTKIWIGNNLSVFLHTKPNCAVLATPYKIGQKGAGACGIIGPMRIPYKQILGILEGASKKLSDFFTKALLKHKIAYKTFFTTPPELDVQKRELLKAPSDISLLEDKR